MTPSLSVAIITYNEEANLRALLPQLDWADEVVVVDSGSTDASLRVAREHGAKVFQRPFDHYAAQRNYAISRAAGDWVLSLDADERPTAGLAGEVRQRMRDSVYAAFRVPIRSTIFGRAVRFGGTQDDRPVRMFRRGCGRWDGDVHEVFHVDGSIGQLDHWLEHFTLPDRAAFFRKMEHYTDLAAAARVAGGIRPTWRNFVLAPPREFFRRLVWKLGVLDGRTGWAFALLSGWSEWVLARKHRELWNEQRNVSEMETRKKKRNRSRPAAHAVRS